MSALLEIKRQVREGSIAGALSAAKVAVREAPSDVSLRSALFALFAVNGENTRSLEQLEICLRLGGEAGMGTYCAILLAEKEREPVMAGRSAPWSPTGVSPDWMATWQGALAALAAGDPEPLERVAAVRETALSAITGSNFEHGFGGFRNCDTRLCGFFEGIFEGRYGWLPFEDVMSISVPGRPELLQDLVWLPVMFRLRSGDPLAGYLFATVPGTGAAGSDSDKMARSASWDETYETVDIGCGVQLFALGPEVVPVFSLGECEFDAASEIVGPDSPTHDSTVNPSL